MRRRFTAALAAVVLLVTPALGEAKAKPKTKTKPKTATTTVSAMPSAQTLAAEQAQRAAQAMLLLQTDQASQAEDLGGGVYQGASIPARYGPVQVTITVVGGKITDAKGTWNIDIPRSIQIDTYVFSLLQTDTVTMQSANLHTVAGATLSVDAFAASLQSALVKAHLSTVGAVPLGPY